MKLPNSTGEGGGRQGSDAPEPLKRRPSSMVLGPAPASSLSSLSSSLEGGEGGEEREALAGAAAAAAALQARHDGGDGEGGGDRDGENDDDEESPAVFFGRLGVDSTQEVVWAESPKLYRPVARQPGERAATDALVQRELSLIHGLFGDKENGGAGSGNGVGPEAAAVVAAAVCGSQQQQQQQSQQSLNAAKTPVAAKGGWRGIDSDEEEESEDVVRQPVGAGDTQVEAAAGDGDYGAEEAEGQHKGAKKGGGSSTAILRSLLFRKSPAPNKRPRPEVTQGKQGGAGSGSSSSMPPPPTPQRSPGATRKRPRPDHDGDGTAAAVVKSAPAAGAGAGAGAEEALSSTAAQGVGMSLLGGLARSIKQGRFKLGFWQQPTASSPPDAAAAPLQPAAAPSCDASTGAPDDTPAGMGGGGADSAGSAAEAGGQRAGDGKPKARAQQRDFLQLLERVRL